MKRQLEERLMTVMCVLKGVNALEVDYCWGGGLIAVVFLAYVVVILCHSGLVVYLVRRFKLLLHDKFESCFTGSYWWWWGSQGYTVSLCRITLPRMDVSCLFLLFRSVV